MIVTTQRDLIRAVAKRWRKTYEPFDKDSIWWSKLGKTKEEVAKELDLLDPETATAEDVNNIIGNGSWTRLTCDECREEVPAVIRVGQEPDYESATANLCQACATKAAKQFENQI